MQKTANSNISTFNYYRLLFSHLILATLFLPAFSKSIAQVPQGFNYQAVMRDSNGELLQNENVTVFIELLQGQANGSSVFNETHSSSTNTFGLVNLHIGSQNTESFSAIDWSQGPYFIRISVNGLQLGTSSLLSVP